MASIPNEPAGRILWCRICQTPHTQLAGLELLRKCPTCYGVAVNGASIWTTLAPVDVQAVRPRSWLTETDRRFLKSIRVLVED